MRGILASLLTCAAILLSHGCGNLGWRGTEADDSAAARELADYKRAHFRALGDEIAGYRSREAVIAAILANDLLWLGDRHDAATIHRAQLALLRELQARGRRLVLAIEAIGVNDEAEVERFLSGAIDLRRLRIALSAQPDGSWLDSAQLDSDFYRDLLAFAKDAQAPVRALEAIPRPPLAQRDARMATRIRELRAEHADALLVVVVGHVHLLGDGHLLEATQLGGEVLLPAVGPGMAETIARQRRRGGDDFVVTSDGILVWAEATAVDD
ncbi:MAG: ChaN family lipoprotein [Planctomycetota bacterium]